MLKRIRYWLFLAIPKPYAAMDQGKIIHGWTWLGRMWERQKPRRR